MILELLMIPTLAALYAFRIGLEILGMVCFRVGMRECGGILFAIVGVLECWGVEEDGGGGGGLLKGVCQGGGENEPDRMAATRAC